MSSRRFTLSSLCHCPLLLAAFIAASLCAPSRADIITPDILTVTDLSTGAIIASCGYCDFRVTGPPGTGAFGPVWDLVYVDPDAPQYARERVGVFPNNNANYFDVVFVPFWNSP